jgi:hypothetical protein
MPSALFSDPEKAAPARVRQRPFLLLAGTWRALARQRSIGGYGGTHVAHSGADISSPWYELMSNLGALGAKTLAHTGAALILLH